MKIKEKFLEYKQDNEKDNTLSMFGFVNFPILVLDIHLITTISNRFLSTEKIWNKKLL